MADTSDPNPISQPGNATPVQAPISAPDPERWVDEHGDYLFHYALSRLRNTAQAEDFVQEALLAGIRGINRYQGRSSERTWLTGILRNKLLDHFRKSGRETNFTDLEFYSEEEDRSFENADHPNHWNDSHAPGRWDNAGSALDREDFWKVFHSCSDKLPDRISRVFLLREVDQIPSDEICSTLNISPNNLWVMLHRARMALRRCLEVHWFRRHDKADE
jgi:RNA polymerase sigma-70 factor (ECF subfamily)